LIFTWLTADTQNNWIFIATIFSAAILVVSTVIVSTKAIVKKINIKRINACYLIPKREYNNKIKYKEAPDTESFPRKLTTGIGLYTILIQIHIKIDVTLDRILITFKGDEKNKPVIEGMDRQFISEPLKKDDLYRDWHGNVHPNEPTYPRPLYHQDCLMYEYKVRTSGKWNGKMSVEIPIRELGKQERFLGFTVSTSDDNIPFLKHEEKIKYI